VRGAWPPPARSLARPRPRRADAGRLRAGDRRGPRLLPASRRLAAAAGRARRGSGAVAPARGACAQPRRRGGVRPVPRRAPAVGDRRRAGLWPAHRARRADLRPGAAGPDDALPTERGVSLAVWVQRTIELEPRPRGFHLVTDEVI